MSAITISTTKPSEQGTAVITMAFTDEDAATVTPTSLAWQLMRSDNGTIINSRTFALGSFSGTEIVLQGDDLAAFGSSDTGGRLFSVQGVYDSSAGSNLPINAELSFSVDKLLGQADNE